MTLLKHGLCVVSAAGLVAGQIAPAWAQTIGAGDQRGPISAGTVAPAPAAPLSGDARFTRADYEACHTRAEAEFRKAIRSITLTALRSGTSGLAYDAIVAEQWRVSGLDLIVDQRVDIAVGQVRDETNWTDLLKSLAYRKQAQELATAVAERTYQSSAIKAALAELATNVGKEIGRAIVLTTADAAGPAQRCLQAYLGPRYGATVSRSVNQDASAAFTIDPKANEAAVSTGTVLLETSSGITGAVLLLVRRQMALMAQRMGQRLVGSVLGRLVSVVAGGVGLVLVAKEFWELRHGVLPIVADEMKSAGSKAKVRQELAQSIREQIDSHLDDLSARTADKIVDIWHDFRRAHAKVVQLAEREPPFKAFIDTAHPSQLARLDEIIALVLDKEGDGAIHKRLSDGSLHAALNRMPEDGMQIAREQQSLSVGLAWTALAGEQLANVVKFDVHKHADPGTTSKEALRRVLALEDRLAITRIAGLEGKARDVLLELDSGNLVSLARTLSEQELGSLAQYLRSLNPDASQRILRVIGARPARMRELASASVRSGILDSRDQVAAVGMMLADAPGFDVFSIYRHAELAWSGRVNPRLMWDKHPAAVIVAVAAGLLILGILRSLLFGRRRRQPGKPEAASS